MHQYAYIANCKDPHKLENTGLTTAEVDSESGMLHLKETVFSELNCSVLCWDSARRIVYAVNERKEVPGENLGGQVYAFRQDPVSGSLIQVNHQPSFGVLPTYCTVDPTGKYLLTVNHSFREGSTKVLKDPEGHYYMEKTRDDTTLVLYPLAEDGAIGEPLDVVITKGKAGNPPAGGKTSLHCAVFSPDGSYFAVCDKGADRVYTFRIENDRLIQLDMLDVKPASGPRYCVFHPSLPYLYYGNEFAPEVGVVACKGDGKLQYLDSVGCGEGLNRGSLADICVTGDGRYLYTIIRENGNLAVFEIGQDDGMLQLVQSLKVCGAGHGWGLALSPDEERLYMGCSPESVIVVFGIQEDGTLSEETRIEAVSPGKMVFTK